MNIAYLHEELEAAGCLIIDVGAGGVIKWSGTPDTTTADLVVAAHEQPPGSAEVIALRNHLGIASDEWLGYKAVRKKVVTIIKREEYLEECLVAILELFRGVTATVSGDYLTNLEWPKDEALVLKGLIQNIKDAHPDDWS